ncbi:hypothetical protein HDV57DRAFT_484765 [Trichoderma longibrachiatum]
MTTFGNVAQYFLSLFPVLVGPTTCHSARWTWGRNACICMDILNLVFYHLEDTTRLRSKSRCKGTAVSAVGQGLVDICAMFDQQLAGIFVASMCCCCEGTAVCSASEGGIDICSPAKKKTTDFFLACACCYREGASIMPNFSQKSRICSIFEQKFHHLNLFLIDSFFQGIGKPT